MKTMLRLLLPTALVLEAAGHKGALKDNVVGLESELVELTMDAVAERLDKVVEKGGNVTKAAINHLAEQALLKEIANISSTISSSTKPTCTELFISLLSGTGTVPNASYVCPSVLDYSNIMPLSPERKQRYYASQSGSLISVTRFDCYTTHSPTDSNWDMSPKCSAPDPICYSHGWPSCCWDDNSTCADSNTGCTGEAIGCSKDEDMHVFCCQVSAAALSGVTQSLLSKYSKVLAED